MIRLLRVLCAVSLLCALCAEYEANFTTSRIAGATTMIPASAPQIVISPISGPAGQQILITLSNFTPATQYYVQDSATGSVLQTPLGTECSGTLSDLGTDSVTCVIPTSANPGNDTITAEDFAGLVATTTFDVLPAGGTPGPTSTGSAGGSPQFAVSPSFGPLTQTIQVALTNFTANSPYTVTDQATGEVLPGDRLSGVSNCAGKGITNLNGNGSATKHCSLPGDFSMGLHTLVATDGAGLQATTTFNVVPAGTSPTSTPSAVATNTAAPTNSPTSTATNTATNGPTPAQTATPTATPGLTSTATVTPSATALAGTATVTASPTASATPPDTATQTDAGSANPPTVSADTSASPTTSAGQAQSSATPTATNASLQPGAVATTAATAVTAVKKTTTKPKSSSCPAHPAKLTLSWKLSGLKGHSLTSGQTLTAAIHTLPHLSVALTVKVQQKKTVTTGKGKKRKTVTRMVTLYQTTVHGKTGTQGTVSSRLHVTYRPAKSVTAQVSVAAAKGCSHATRSTHVSLLPAHKKPASTKKSPSAKTASKSTKGKGHKA